MVFFSPRIFVPFTSIDYARSDIIIKANKCHRIKSNGFVLATKHLDSLFDHNRNVPEHNIKFSELIFIYGYRCVNLFVRPQCGNKKFLYSLKHNKLNWNVCCLSIDDKLCMNEDRKLSRLRFLSILFEFVGILIA